MTEPRSSNRILRRTFGPASTGLRVLTVEEERRGVRRARYRPRRDLDLDRRLRALGYMR